MRLISLLTSGFCAARVMEINCNMLLTSEMRSFLTTFSQLYLTSKIILTDFPNFPNNYIDCIQKKLSFDDNVLNIQLNRQKWGSDLPTSYFNTFGVFMTIEKLVKFNYSVNCYSHGNKRLRLGDKSGAIKYYSSAISQNPDFVEAYLNRGTAKAESGSMLVAIENYSYTLGLEPHLASA